MNEEQMKYIANLISQDLEKDKEIERLKNGYCDLKVKCNNGECDCTSEEYDGMVQANMKLSLEVERLNNIIEANKRNYSNLVKEWKKQNNIINELDKMFDGDLDGFFTINEKGSCNEIIEVIQNYKDKLKELKEGR